MAGIEAGDLGRLLPLHLQVSDDGRILSAGPTLRKIIGPARHLDAVLEVHRPHPGLVFPAAILATAARSGERVFVRLIRPPHTMLRGHGTLARDGSVLLDLGFGIGLSEAVRHFNLTDADFPPSGLVMELLFLHEANAAVLSALSDYNAQLDARRQAAEDRAFTDPLTGLANRRGLTAALEAAMRGLRGQGVPGRRGADRAGFSLLHLDLDGFKAVNDTWGHAAGDRLLTEVAAVLSAETRVGDAVARPGGDEFVLVMPGLVAPEALDALACRIIRRIERPVALPQGEARVSASIGIAVSTDYAGGRLASMSEDADDALYAAKRAGRGRACRLEGPLRRQVMVEPDRSPPPAASGDAAVPPTGAPEGGTTTTAPDGGTTTGGAEGETKGAATNLSAEVAADTGTANNAAGSSRADVAGEAGAARTADGKSTADILPIAAAIGDGTAAARTDTGATDMPVPSATP